MKPPGDPVRLDVVAKEAPELFESLVSPGSVFASPENRARCARFWDAVLLMEKFGVDARSAPDGVVVCRECGEAVGSVAEHLEGSSTTVERYREMHPAAPVTPEERVAFPAPRMEW